MSNLKLPQIIILYGPPAAGKGTQAHFLKQKLPEYYHLDFGTELRSFVKNNIGDFHIDTEEINPDSSEELLVIARRIKKMMKDSFPVKSSDLRFVIEKSINDCVARGQGMIIEGPGRLVEEAQWLSNFMNEKQIEVVIFHLYISIEQVLERAKSRYYLPSTKKPFKSYEEAMQAREGHEEPYRRPEDQDQEGTKQRYKLMYSDNFARIISIYQLQAKSLVFNVDASNSIEEVSNTMLSYFDKFYGVSL